jgi:capsular polysaccharide transport system ATP-binding protein
MITLQAVTKNYPSRVGTKHVIRDASFNIHPGEVIGILGRNGAGKSTMVRLLSGAESPSSGSIVRSMSVSWPLAFGGGFQGSLSGLDNIRFICRVYGAKFARVHAYVQDFSELGTDLNEPLKSYSTGMSARLAFAISMAIEFDCYLIDEIIAVGDSRFYEKCRTELFERRKSTAKVIVSHQPELIRAYCTTAALIMDGIVKKSDSVEEVIAAYFSA